MKTIRTRIAPIAVAALAAGTVVAGAQDEAPAGDAAAAQAKMQEMMMAYMEAMATTEEHAEMAKLAGTWTTKETMWPMPGVPPQSGSGTATYTPVFDGRYVETTHKSSYFGTPFEGKGILAYDKQTGEYIQTWIDNMSTTVMVTRGKEREDGSVEFSGKYDDPVEKREVSYRMVLVFDSPDQHTFTMFKEDAEGKEGKSMEIVYTRKK